MNRIRGPVPENADARGRARKKRGRRLLQEQGSAEGELVEGLPHRPLINLAMALQGDMDPQYSRPASIAPSTIVRTPSRFTSRTFLWASTALTVILRYEL